MRTGTPGDLELFLYTFTGTAKQGVDYTITYGPVIPGTNGPNEIRQEITIHPTDDLVIEGTEMIKVELCFSIIAICSLHDSKCQTHSDRCDGGGTADEPAGRPDFFGQRPRSW